MFGKWRHFFGRPNLIKPINLSPWATIGPADRESIFLLASTAASRQVCKVGGLREVVLNMMDEGLKRAEESPQNGTNLQLHFGQWEENSNALLPFALCEFHVELLLLLLNFDELHLHHVEDVIGKANMVFNPILSRL